MVLLSVWFGRYQYFGAIFTSFYLTASGKKTERTPLSEN